MSASGEELADKKSESVDFVFKPVDPFVHSFLKAFNLPLYFKLLFAHFPLIVKDQRYYAWVAASMVLFSRKG